MIKPFIICFTCACQSLFSTAQPLNVEPSFSAPETSRKARVVIVQDAAASHTFNPRPEVIRKMVERAITNLTATPTVAAAWSSLVSTQDTVGIKVFSGPGETSGTRPAVVAAVVQGLLEAKVPPRKIIIWDKQILDLRRAGFFDLAERFGVRVASSSAAGYDDKISYDTAFIGQLIWGDLEFGKKGEGIGRKSFVSKLLTKEITRLINITPLLNHNFAGVSGNLYGLTMGSLDNTQRFENSAERLASAVPEIYALPALGDRVALNIVDALICQYEGGQEGLLHYSAMLNELRFSTDPVALDVLSIQELERLRSMPHFASSTNSLELYQNASLLELGVSDSRKIQVERIP